MFVSSITPLSGSNGKSKVSTVNVIPQVHRSIPDSVAFKGHGSKLGLLGSVAMALGLTACPSGSEPSPDVKTNTDTSTTTATNTDTLTKTSTATATATDTATYVVRDKTPADKFLTSLQMSGIAPADATEVPKSFQYKDTWNAANVAETLDTATNTDAKITYKGVTTYDVGPAQSYTKTYELDGNKNLIQTTNSTAGGVGFETKAKITYDNGFMKFWMMDGTLDCAWKDIGGGKIGVFDRSDLTKPYTTLDNVKIDGSPLAMIKRMLGKAKNVDIAYETKANGKTIRGAAHDAPIMRFAEGVAYKIAESAKRFRV